MHTLSDPILDAAGQKIDLAQHFIGIQPPLPTVVYDRENRLITAYVTVSPSTVEESGFSAQAPIIAIPCSAEPWHVRWIVAADSGLKWASFGGDGVCIEEQYILSGPIPELEQRKRRYVIDNSKLLTFGYTIEVTYEGDETHAQVSFPADSISDLDFGKPGHLIHDPTIVVAQDPIIDHLAAAGQGQEGGLVA